MLDKVTQFYISAMVEFIHMFNRNNDQTQYFISILCYPAICNKLFLSNLWWFETKLQLKVKLQSRVSAENFPEGVGRNGKVKTEKLHQ